MIGMNILIDFVTRNFPRLGKANLYRQRGHPITSIQKPPVAPLSLPNSFLPDAIFTTSIIFIDLE
jgi:hypothetical protein